VWGRSINNTSAIYLIIMRTFLLQFLFLLLPLSHRACVKRFVSLQFLNITQSVGLLGRGIRPTQGLYLHRTTQTQNKTLTNIHALSGIRNHDPSVRAAEDISCLRTRGHCDRLLLQFSLPKLGWALHFGNCCLLRIFNIATIATIMILK
jgi:hypothetical protein